LRKEVKRQGVFLISKKGGDYRNVKQKRLRRSVEQGVGIMFGIFSHATGDSTPDGTGQIFGGKA